MNRTAQRSGLLALFSSASTLASIAAAFSVAGVTLAPTQAIAANECVPLGVDPAANGATADTYDCPSATNYSGTGISYNSSGNLTVASSGGAINVGTAGINLVGAGADTVTLTTTAGTVTGTGGPVIDVSSSTGAISVSAAGITGTAAGVTYGVQANSTSGAITVSTTGTVNVSSNTVGASQVAGISASSAGNVTITTSGSVTGRVFGIQGVTTGTGVLTINANNAVTMNTATAGVGSAAIEAVAGSGALTVNVGTGSGTVAGGPGAAIRTSSTGAQTITVAAGRTVSTTGTTPTVLLQGGGAKTVTNAGSISGTTAIRASGTTFTLTNSGSTSGLVHLTNTGATTITNSGTLSATGVVIQAAGTTFTLTNSGTLSGRLALTNSGAATVTNSGTWNTSGATAFNSGSSTLTNSGTLNAGSGTVFTSLETFNNSGTLALGSNTLTSTGTTFNATGSSRITLNVACAAAGAGCLNLSNGTVTGETSLVVSGLSDTSAFDPSGILLINVAGGTTSADNFVLDPTSTNFVDDPALGGVISTSPLFGYALRFNEDTDQHLLVSVPRNDAFEFVPYIHETLSVWQTTTDTVVGRQSDLRDGAMGGGWVRIVGEHTERDLAQSFASAGNTFEFDNSYALDTLAIIAGFDLLQTDSMVLGVHGGVVRSELEFDNSETTDEMDGVTLGLYGGTTASSGLTFDAAFNTNLLTLDHSSPTFEDISTNVISFGARGEVGWKMALGESFYIQPIGTASYVNVDIDELAPSGYEISFDDVESFAAAIGVRLGGQAGSAGYWLTGRAWSELADQTSVRIRHAATSSQLRLLDDLGDDYQEVNGGVSFTTGAWTGYASAGAKLHDDIDNYNIGVGLRLHW